MDGRVALSFCIGGQRRNRNARKSTHRCTSLTGYLDYFDYFDYFDYLDYLCITCIYTCITCITSKIKKNNYWLTHWQLEMSKRCWRVFLLWLNLVERSLTQTDVLWCTSTYFDWLIEKAFPRRRDKLDMQHSRRWNLYFRD